jgi:hypothetical protein
LWCQLSLSNNGVKSESTINRQPSENV